MFAKIKTPLMCLLTAMVVLKNAGAVRAYDVLQQVGLQTVIEQVARQAAQVDDASVMNAARQIVQFAIAGGESGEMAKLLLEGLIRLSEQHGDAQVRRGALRLIEAVQIVIRQQSGGGQNQPAPPSYQPQPPAYQPPAADLAPEPNYRWVHGARYTATQLMLYDQWVDRQTHLTFEEKLRMKHEVRRQCEEDERSEQEWIKSAFGNPYL